MLPNAQILQNFYIYVANFNSTLSTHQYLLRLGTCIKFTICYYQ
jgi:hypothetical protein